MTDEYLELNRANWDDRAPKHAASPGYALDRFLADPEHLSDVVRFDLPRLGDIRGQRAVHLQCHIGTDTLSLARLGATVTGLDFSGASIAEARRLAERAGAAIEYVEADVYRALDVLPARAFDLVYTGIGALGWLPSIERWADVVAGLVAPGGRLFLREGHPVMWMLDEDRADELVVRYPYFETAAPLVSDVDETYVETDAKLTATVTHEWNHGLGEILGALLARGFTITGFVEHRSVPWLALPGRMTLGELGEWHLTDDPDLLPLTYTLQAVAPR